MASCDLDVAIVGGGLAGSALAATLVRRGLRAALFDVHDIYPPDFRAEKLTRDQVAALERLQLATPVLRAATVIDEVWIARRGRIVERRPNREVGIDYADLVNAVRGLVPPKCRRVARITRVEASNGVQRLHLRTGEVVAARLAVIATGPGQALPRDLGVRRIEEPGVPSLAIGFDLVAPPGTPPLPALTYYGEDRSDLSAYLTVFPIGERARANLFVYRAGRDVWAREFRTRPAEQLVAAMPGLRPLLGAFTVPETPVVRPVALYRSEAFVRDGAVLVGDAFSTSCPAGGTGIGKVLTDVERLVALIPSWLATDGMGHRKIAQFYADPAKRACDAAAQAMTRYARSMAIERGPIWAVRRFRNFHVQRARYQLRRLVERAHSTRREG